MQHAPAAIDWQAFRVGGIAVTANHHHAGRPNVALMHGALGDSSRIAPIAPYVADCNLAFFDMRGHGRSHRPADGYAIEDLAAEMVEPLGAVFGSAPLAILAESFSGVVALAITRRVENVRHLVLVDTPFDTRRMRASHLALMRAHARLSPEERPPLEALCRAFFGLDVATGDVVPLSFHGHLAGRRAATTMVTGSRKASREPDAAEPAAYFETADLLALGADDGAPLLDVVEIQGGGHRLMKTHLAQVAAALRRVLDESGMRAS